MFASVHVQTGNVPLVRGDDISLLYLVSQEHLESTWSNLCLRLVEITTAHVSAPELVLCHRKYWEWSNKCNTENKWKIQVGWFASSSVQNNNKTASDFPCLSTVFVSELVEALE